MPNNPRIVVISHAASDYSKGGYLLHRLTEHWQERGIETVVMEGPQQAPPDADLAISHIDMTAVDPEYQRLFSHYPLVVNGRVLDISKTVFSDQLIRLEDNYDGPVIVKTNRNFGGMREMKARQMQGDAEARLDVVRPWRKLEFLPSYPTYASAMDVPLGAWRNPNLVVEKFLPEQNRDGQYVLRVWIFFGDREFHYQCISDEPIIKSRNTITRETLDVAEVPGAIHAKREQLGFDYGKFDFGIVNGEAVLYDVNRTPGSARGGTVTERAKQNVLELSQGLDYFLAKLDS